MRGDNQQKIGDVIRKFLKNKKLDRKMLELDAVALFETSIGTALMKYVQETSLSEGKMYVKINSSIVRNELSYQKTVLIQKINNQLKQEVVKELILL